MLQLLLIDKKLGDVHTILLSARVQIEQWVSSNPTQKESLRVFFLILQVCHYLMAGQVRCSQLLWAVVVDWLDCQTVVPNNLLFLGCISSPKI